MEIVWSRAADRDLARIYSYLEPRSLRAVRGLLRRLFKAIDLLAEMPRMGTVADLGLEREVRQHVVEHYKIFYYVEEERPAKTPRSSLSPKDLEHPSAPGAFASSTNAAMSTRNLMSPFQGTS